MWKPWILISIGSVLIANIAAKGHNHGHADSVAAYNSKNEASHIPFSYSKCAKEIEEACGHKVE